MKQAKSRRVDLIGTFDSVLKLETAIARETGVRFIIRLNKKTALPRPNNLLHRLQKDWEPDATVAGWRDVLVDELNKQLSNITLTKADIDVITPQGVLASGNTLITNCRFDT